MRTGVMRRQMAGRPSRLVIVLEEGLVEPCDDGDPLVEVLPHGAVQGFPGDPVCGLRWVREATRACTKGESTRRRPLSSSP